MSWAPSAPFKWAWYDYLSVSSWLRALLFVCLFDLSRKRLHENLFCSSPSLSQFPWRKRLIGSNVGQITLSVPLFPCVNSLSTKNTASLCIYCVRRWVLFFFSSPLSVDIESCLLLSLVKIIEWAWCWTEWWCTNGREKWKEASVRRTVCAKFFFFYETNACKSWEEPVTLCECERKKEVRVSS